MLGDARQAGPTARENASADAGSAECRSLGKYARRSAAPSRSGSAGTGGRLFRHPGMERGDAGGMLSLSGENSTWLGRALAKGMIDDRGGGESFACPFPSLAPSVLLSLVGQDADSPASEATIPGGKVSSLEKWPFLPSVSPSVRPSKAGNVGFSFPPIYLLLNGNSFMEWLLEVPFRVEVRKRDQPTATSS